MTATSRTKFRRPALRGGAALIVCLCALLLPSLAQAAAAPAWRLISVTGPTNLPPFSSEIERLLVNAEDGTFTLRFEGAETGSIPFDATPAELAHDLETLPGVGAGNVEVSGGPGDASATSPYFIRFVGALTSTNVGQLTTESANLTGAGHEASVSTLTQGGTAGQATLAAYPTNVGGAPSSGPVKIRVGPLPGGVTATAATGGNGTGWSCLPLGVGLQIVECESPSPVVGGETGDPLLVPLTINPGAPANSHVTVSVRGGGAPGIAEGVYSYEESLVVSSEPARPGVAAFWAGAFDADGASSTLAGAHPNLAATGFLLNTVVAPAGKVIPAADLRTVNVELPPGFLGNPLVAPRCPQSALLRGRGEACTDASILGSARALTALFGGSGRVVPGQGEVVNDEPPFGYPAEFGFEVTGGPVFMLGLLRSDADYGISIEAPDIIMGEYAYGNFVSLLGTPPNAPGAAFLTNPTDCAEQARQSPVTTIQNNSWQDQDPDAVDNELTVTIPPVTNCAALAGRFRPGFAMQPQDHHAASPSAFTARLSMPQEGLTQPGQLAAPELKKAVVTLPDGLDVNPASASGLAACTEAQMGLTTTSGAPPNPIRFDKSEPSCPDASKLGTLEAKSPLLEETLGGTIYLAAQDKNPFHSLLALYLVIDSPRNGILVKLPGEVKPDPASGQLTATFDNNPQLPVEDLKLNFRGGGPRSPLATPAVCGTYTTRGELTPWSAPESGPPAQTTDSFQVTSGPGGGACATSETGLPFSPSFEAGTTSTQAGAYAPLVIKVGRRDGEQELTRLDFTLPPGLTGKLAGIPYCPDSAIAAAAGKSGRAEQAAPSCPVASELGTVDTSAGVGSEPIHVGGHVYLAGPYRGAPLSAVVITPAVAGPFDLGTVVVRAALQVDPETAQITARSDEIPHILRGIPLQLRSVEIKVTRQGFALNPTSCDPTAVGSTMSGLDGGGASPSGRFQVGGCDKLKFGPHLKLRLKGATGRTGHPSLRAVVTMPRGGANIRRAQVNLPHGEFLDQGNIDKACTRPVLLAGDCPKRSVYGWAKAWTPLLSHPLEGHVYLVGGYGYKLPALVADLNGQVRVTLVGKVDSGKNKGIRNTFEVVPDAPVSRFVLKMKGGKKYGLLENSEDLCKAKKARRRAVVRFVGQNGKARQWKPVVANQCRKHGKKKTRKKTAHGRVRRQEGTAHDRTR